METVILPDAASIGRLAADEVCALVTRAPSSVLGLATGSSPLPTYAEIVRRHEAGAVSFAQCRAFTLDEYVGLSDRHPQQYRTVIRDELTDRIDIDDRRVHGPDGLADDLVAAAAEYEASIASAGGVDLQIVGIGTDGHIGFNEPGSSLASRTRIKTLTRQTRVDNQRFFGGDLSAVPTHCLTQGLGTISDARHVLLVATGEEKSQAVRELVEGAVSARWPATVLQHHPHVSVLIDDAAASRLELGDYYRETFAAKPDWQGL